MIDRRRALAAPPARSAPASLGAGRRLRPARARVEKIAVLVLATADKDADLADNLTEVIIAYAAQHGGFEVAGKEEFRARLGVESERRAQACLDDVACLGRAGVSLGVRRIVAGSVGTRGKQVLFNLVLDNVQDGKVESRVFRLVEGGVENLIKAVQEAASELFRPRAEPGKIQVSSDPAGARVAIDNAYLGVTPLISPTLVAGKHNVRVEATDRFPWTSRVEVRPGEELQIRLTPDNLPRRRRWPANAATLSTALAAGGVRDRRLPGRAVADAAERRLAPGGDAGPGREARVRARRQHRVRCRRAAGGDRPLPLHPLPRRHLRTYRAIRRYPLGSHGRAESPSGRRGRRWLRDTV